MRWFTSDLHLGHVAIITFCGRPFRDVGEQTALLGQAWNECVAPDDEVWILGDLAMSRNDPELARVAGWNGTKHLIAGNHDKAHPRQNPTAQALAIYRDAGIDIVGTSTSIEIGGVEVLLSHFPPLGDSGPIDRYPQFRPPAPAGRGEPSRRGGWIVHGHVHDVWRQRGKWINVGVDAWAGRPVSEHELHRLIATGPGELDRLPWERPAPAGH